MKKRSLVSVITPVYNGEHHLFRLLDSILMQDYNNIELIIIDDGSTDNTKQVVDLYKEKFSQANIKLIYQFQENAGQAQAINQGLKLMSGYYLTWIDSDDFFKYNSISERVDALEEKGEGYFCMAPCEVVKENDPDTVIKVVKRIEPQGEDTLFMDLILVNNVTFAGAGALLISTKDFTKALPTNEIFASREGQNWQLMLPLAYHFKCIYMKEPLSTITQRMNSHSQIRKDAKAHLKRHENFIELLHETIKRIQCNNEKELLDLITKDQVIRIMNAGRDGNDISVIKKGYNIYKASDFYCKEIEVFHSHFKNIFSIIVFKIIRKLNIIKRK